MISNILCAKTTRTITNYTSISKYHLHFFLRKKFSCLYSFYFIKIKYYIFYKYRKFNKY